MTINTTMRAMSSRAKEEATTPPTAAPIMTACIAALSTGLEVDGNEGRETVGTKGTVKSKLMVEAGDEGGVVVRGVVEAGDEGGVVVRGVVEAGDGCGLYQRVCRVLG